ncbi:hypothetical protein [Streptomyces sp. NPDC056361]|uniref:hypothetical protein n=1 Tax=Streptomyces sp. NPDC056361 TaxID=3345795 RepID=UPI0035E39FEE
MRWAALVTKTVVAGAAGVFLAVSAANVQTPPASDADPGREVPAEQRPGTPEAGAGPGTGADAGARTPGPTAAPTVGPSAEVSSPPSSRPPGS